jgi:hypothetical protein
MRCRTRRKHGTVQIDEVAPKVCRLPPFEVFYEPQ